MEPGVANVIPILIPVMMMTLVVIFGITILIVKHQQKMAELIHGNNSNKGGASSELAEEIRRLQAEISTLRDIVLHQQNQIDSLGQRAQVPNSDLTTRLTE